MNRLTMVGRRPILLWGTFAITLCLVLASRLGDKDHSKGISTVVKLNRSVHATPVLFDPLPASFKPSSQANELLALEPEIHLKDEAQPDPAENSFDQSAAAAAASEKVLSTNTRKVTVEQLMTEILAASEQDEPLDFSQFEVDTPSDFQAPFELSYEGDNFNNNFFDSEKYENQDY